MKNGKHVQTDFIKFIIEKYSNIDLEDETLKLDNESQDEKESKPKNSKSKKDEEDVNEEDDEIIEKLLTEYQKVKKEYESY